MKKYIDIFFRFFRVGAFTFGGGLAMLPILENELSEGEHPYLSKQEIADNYALAQCAPGIIAVNTSILSGYQISGTIGGIVAAFGVCVPSVIVILIIASLLSNFMNNEIVTLALMGVRSGVCALVLKTVSNLLTKSIVDKITLGLFLACLAFLTFLPISPVVPVVVGGVLGVMAKKAGEHK